MLSCPIGTADYKIARCSIDDVHSKTRAAAFWQDGGQRSQIIREVSEQSFNPPYQALATRKMQIFALRDIAFARHE